jgi:alpha-1,4-digalacturonate transport system substrate-binding protein
MNKCISIMLVVLILLTGISITAQDDVEIRFLWYDDGSESEIMRDLLDRFEAENPGITIVLDNIPYPTLRDNLRIQVEAGEAPDMSRITDFAGSAGFYLDLRPLLSDPGIMEDNFNGAILAAFRTGPDDDGLYGFPDQTSVTAPYVNATLFEQAGVAMPHTVMDEPTWEDWSAALEEVAAATEVPYIFTTDNKGHRFAGPAMSMGSEFFDEEGNFNFADGNDEGFRKFAEMQKGWLDNGLMPADIWGGQFTSGDQYFSNVQTVMYFSGSWQINRFANDIGDAFDWIVAPNPYGDGGSTGVAGGAGIVGYAQTEHPEEVAMIMEYLMTPEIYNEWSARSLLIPANTGAIELGIEFQTDNPQVAAALNGFASEVPKLQYQAVALNPNEFAFAYYDSSNTRLAQYFAGELTLDEMMERIHEDLDEARANAEAGE